MIEKKPEEIAAVLVDWVARKTGLPGAEIDRNRRFDHYGLDSTDAVMLIGDLEDLVGRPLSAALPYRHPTIAALAQVLARGGSE
jgi:polyketide synthase 13